MKGLLSHFEVTPKSAMALFAAVTAYLVLRGKMTTEERQSYILIATTLLTFLKGKRTDPDGLGIRDAQVSDATPSGLDG